MQGYAGRTLFKPPRAQHHLWSIAWSGEPNLTQDINKKASLRTTNTLMSIDEIRYDSNHLDTIQWVFLDSPMHTKRIEGYWKGRWKIKKCPTTFWSDMLPELCPQVIHLHNRCFICAYRFFICAVDAHPHWYVGQNGQLAYFVEFGHFLGSYM